MISSDVLNDVNKAAGAVLNSAVATVGPAAGAVMNSAVAAVGPDPTEFLNSQLASALSTLGDAQFWEETISPTTIRHELSASDPSNPNSTTVLSKGMKWLLASISKGRDVSDFYPHVVKLVGATSLEVRKMVYMYLVQYADHDATTRELSLLSINAFQRGLSDEEQLIRALALRVLSSIRINDILQIQILGVQKCASDTSPYVRKCAANALAKLVPRCDDMQRQMMLQLLKEELLDKDTSAMVLTSTLVTFCEICPERLELLHASYRKICHLLTDMDEWGQVVVIDLMARYCRRFFKQPKALKQGKAELIDKDRRVQRRLSSGGRTTTRNKMKTEAETKYESVVALKGDNTNAGGGGFKDFAGKGRITGGFKDAPVSNLVTTKGFYSDSEDDSTDDEAAVPSVASLMRQPPVVGNPISSGVSTTSSNVGVGAGVGVGANFDPDLKQLDPDHQLLLTSSMSLLKSRNAGVVLAVCSLHYYCGVASVKARSAIGKALVRIHRGRREIQYVVLTSIRALVRDCPSAFAPFLQDFFVKTLDPPFTRLIKIDILVSLALEPAAIEAVLDEFRAYILHGDKEFATSAIRAVGRVVELARIVHDRHGASSGRVARERQAANRVGLNALHGLCIVTQVSESKAVVGEAVSAMQSILQTLCTSMTLSDGSTSDLQDPNEVRTFAMRRILLLLVSSLSNRHKSFINEPDEESDDEVEVSELDRLSVQLNSAALSSALWIVGEWLSESPLFSASTWMHGSNNKSKAKSELLRLIHSCFPHFKSFEKEQAIHFASKMWIFHVVSHQADAGSSDIAICENILAMGRLDVNPNIKDRARFESGLLHASNGLKYDTNGIDAKPDIAILNQEQAIATLRSNKPSPSYLPIVDDARIELTTFRFGTLSSLVGHQARGASTLPPWAEKNSPTALREPVEVPKQQQTQNFSEQGQNVGFYDNYDNSSDNDSSVSDSSSSSSGSSESSSGSESSGSESDSDDDSNDSSEEKGNGNFINTVPPIISPNEKIPNNQIFNTMSVQQNAMIPQPSKPNIQSYADSSDDDSSESDDTEDSSDESENRPINSVNIVGKSPTENSSQGEGNLLGLMSGFPSAQESNNKVNSSTMDDFKGLTMEPMKANDPTIRPIDLERDSSTWAQLVRPELCGGLSVESRYLRDTTKEHEMRIRNIETLSVNVLCIQLRFCNRKSDSSSIRRIKVLPRSGSGAKKTLCPPEIFELKANQSTTSIVFFQFTAMSNREGDIVGKIEVKQGYGGSIPIEFKPPLGELLHKPPTMISVREFDVAVARMQGFQRAESSCTSSKPLAIIAKMLSKQSSLKCIGDGNDKLRMMGLLPVGNGPVMVKIERNPYGGKVIVCCDDVVAINSIMSLVKQRVSS